MSQLELIPLNSGITTMITWCPWDKVLIRRVAPVETLKKCEVSYLIWYNQENDSIYTISQYKYEKSMSTIIRVRLTCPGLIHSSSSSATIPCFGCHKEKRERERERKSNTNTHTSLIQYTHSETYIFNYFTYDRIIKEFHSLPLDSLE